MRRRETVEPHLHLIKDPLYPKPKLPVAQFYVGQLVMVQTSMGKKVGKIIQKFDGLSDWNYTVDTGDMKVSSTQTKLLELNKGMHQ